MKAVDVHGFGGGFTLGTVQAGFDLVGKMSRSAGFGVLNTLANRHLLGDGWDSITGVTEGMSSKNRDDWQAPDDWESIEADYVFGNPPCSGFSTLSRKEFRGADSPINSCMWELVRYAGRVAPQIVAWESVQQTFRQGLPLMRDLHDELERITGKQYTLYHVLHNNASLGGASIRKRYFWVASQIPFGVDRNPFDRHGDEYELTAVPTFADILRDLEPLGMSLLPQPYKSTMCRCGKDRASRGFMLGDYEPHMCPCAERGEVRVLNSSFWNEREVHDGTGVVDGHNILYSPGVARTLEVIDGYQGTPGVNWEQGERSSDVMRRYYQKFGVLPQSWDYLTRKVDANGEVVQLKKSERLIETDFAMGHNQLTRWRGDRMARVITGGACHLVLHPHQDRTLTQREAARIQGFPDDWHIFPVRRAPDLGPGWGKGVPVQAGRWISSWAKRSLEGNPGPLTGLPVEQTHKKIAEVVGPRDREYVIDLANDYKRFTVPMGDPA